MTGVQTCALPISAAYQGQANDGNTDMLILGPLLLVAIGVALALRQGKPISNGAQIAVGAAALFGVLVVAEVFHLNSAGSDIESWGTANFGAGVFTAGVAYGAWIGAIAAIGVAFGAVRHYMAAKAT